MRLVRVKRRSRLLTRDAGAPSHELAMGTDAIVTLLALASRERAQKGDMMNCRGLRGATTATANTRDAMLEATRELLTRLVERNGIAIEDIVSVFFTVTDDLNAVYPALAAREMGWTETALLCAREIPVEGATTERCVRVLLHVNTERTAREMQHVYLRDAVVLRPGWADRDSAGA